MHLLMKTSLSGPLYNYQRGTEVPFDENFPFSRGEVRRFIDPDGADMADFVGNADDLAAWLGDEADVVPALYGSSTLPAIVDVGGYQVQLGGIVCAAFGFFAQQLPTGTTEAAAATAWNEVSETDRDDALALLVNLLDADPAKIPELIAETSIVARPNPPKEAAAPAAPVVEAAPKVAPAAEPAPRKKRS